MLRLRGLPLLTKELLEQSARPRTYVIRAVYAALLFFCSLLVFYLSSYQDVANPLSLFGRGRDVFRNVVKLQFAGVYLFMPAITCGAIAAEKERNTIGLLLLTRLGPTTILLEKLLSRLVPMGSFLLLSLPLMGFAYSMGGVGQWEFWIVVWCLLLTAVQVGVLALACSAYCRTTVQAFMATYFCGFLMYMVCSCGTGLPLVAPLLLLDRWNRGWPYLIGLSAPTIGLIVVLFLAARAWVIRRAFVQPQNLTVKFLRRLDAFFQELNDNSFTRGVVLFDESVQLPGDDPIAWRETRKKALGMYRYLFRFLVATEGPVLLVCCFIATDNPRNIGGASRSVSVMLFMIWILGGLMVTVKAASLIAGERSHETLDVLLSTPIRSREIFRQKFHGVRRLMFIIACPLVTIVLFQAYFRMGQYGQSLWHVSPEVKSQYDWRLYALAALSSIAINLPLLAWVSFQIGSRFKSQMRAIFTALAVVAAWCALPIVAGDTLRDIMGAANFEHSPLAYLMLLSPGSLILFAERSELDTFNQTPWPAVLLNIAIYLPALLYLRRHSLRTAALRLGRAEVPRYEPELPAPVSGFPADLHRRAIGRALLR
ncbi:MAG: ABC transporter permease subunit [Planctomycetaceae bacterium]